MKRTVLTPDQDAEILRRYLAGERVQDLADEHGVSTPTIYARIPLELRRGPGGGPRRAATETPAASTPDAEPSWREANPSLGVTVKPAAKAAAVSAFKDAQITYRGATFGYYPPLCEKPHCGTDHASPVDAMPIVVTDHRVRGHLRRFCSWHCLSRHAIRAELAGGDA